MTHINYTKRVCLVCGKHFSNYGRMKQHMCSKQPDLKIDVKVKDCYPGYNGQDDGDSKCSNGYTAAGLHQTRNTIGKKKIVKDRLTDSNASSEINNLNQEMDFKENLAELVDTVAENGDKSDLMDAFENSDSAQTYNAVSAGDHTHADSIDASPGLPHQDSAGKLALENVSDIDGSPAEVKHLGCVDDDGTRNTTCASYIKSVNEVITYETELCDGEIKKGNVVTEIDVGIDENEDMRVEDSINNGSVGVKYEDSPKMYACRHCKVTFDLRGEYLQHLRDKHFRCSFLQCDKCGLKIKWRNAGEHICQVCEFCKKVFNSHNALKKHIEKAQKCKICGKIFCSQVSFRSHKKADMCEIVLPCDQCGKVFNSQIAYDSHQKKHAKYKNKAFQCEICEQGYEELVYLKKHYLMHEGKFLCSYCKKKCYDKQHLELHQNMCSKTFKVNSYVYEDAVMNKGSNGSKDEVPKSLKSCPKTSNDISHVENDKLIEKNLETKSLDTDDEDLNSDQTNTEEPYANNLVLGTADREHLNSEVNNARLIVISNDLSSKTLIEKKDIDIGRTVSSNCKQNEENMFSLETLKNSDKTLKRKTKPSLLETSSIKDSELLLSKSEKVIQNDIYHRDLNVNGCTKVKRKFDLVNSSCGYENGLEKSLIYEDSNNINDKDIVNDTNTTSYSRSKHFLEESSSSEESETDDDTDNDSSGYVECSEEEVKQMLFEMRYK